MNDTPAALLVALIRFLVGGVISHPQALQVQRVETPKTDLFYLTVNPDDLGRLLGREGRTVEAIRVLAEAAVARYGKAAVVDVVEPQHRQGQGAGARSRRRDRRPRGRGRGKPKSKPKSR